LSAQFFLGVHVLGAFGHVGAFIAAGGSVGGDDGCVSLSVLYLCLSSRGSPYLRMCLLTLRGKFGRVM
jgi:hypothetical protein